MNDIIEMKLTHRFAMMCWLKCCLYKIVVPSGSMGLQYSTICYIKLEHESTLLLITDLFLRIECAPNEISRCALTLETMHIRCIFELEKLYNFVKTSHWPVRL